MKGRAHPAAFRWRAMMGSLAHHPLSLHLEKLDTLDMSEPRNKHLAGKPRTVPGHTTTAQSSSWDPSNPSSCSSGTDLCTTDPDRTSAPFHKN